MDNLQKKGILEMDSLEMKKINGGGFGPFGFGWRIVMRPSLIMWQSQQIV